MNRAAIDHSCERGILLVLLATLIFAPLIFGAVTVGGVVAVGMGVLTMTALWTVRLTVSARPRLHWPPAAWGVLAFVIYAAARWRTADIEYIARQEVLRVALYGLVFLIAVNNLRQGETRTAVATTLIAVATLLSLLAILQHFRHDRQIFGLVARPPGYGSRGGGTFVNPNHLAGFLEMVLPFGLALGTLGRLGHASRILVLYASAVILAGLAVTVSRGGWLATGVSLILFLAILAVWHRRWIRAGMVALLVGAITVFILVKFDPLRTRPDVTQASPFDPGNGRHWYWEAALDMWGDHRWLGVGPGHYAERFRQYRGFHSETQISPEYVHNDYLNTLADWGALGLGLVGVFLILVAFDATRNLLHGRRGDDGSSRSGNRVAVATGAVCGLTAILIHSLVDFNMHIPANALTAVTLCALLAAPPRKDRNVPADVQWPAARRIGAALVALALLAAGAGVAWMGGRAWREAAWLERAGAGTGTGAERFAALQAAFEVEPANPRTADRLGEFFRAQSGQGDADYVACAGQALQWYAVAAALNPWDPYIPLHQGWCLDWTGRGNESQTFYDRAVRLDPNGYYTASLVGWHWYQREDYAEARRWFRRSLRLRHNQGSNPVTLHYLPLVEKKLAEARR